MEGEVAMSQGSPLEWQMLDLINAERAAFGLDPLLLEQRLNDAAEDHSEWMIDTDRFSHTGIAGSSPTERMRDADFDLTGSWSTAENIAWQSVRGAPGLADDVIDLHESLMNSPGHRANILSPTAEVIGIGIERGDFNGWDGIIVTQNFARTGAPVDLDVRPGTSPQDPVPGPFAMQIGKETVSQQAPSQWHTVAFDGPIADAVVIMGPVSGDGGDPVTVRVQNVTDTGFQFQLEEWDYLDGAHMPETISWMAVTEGTHQMADGRTIVAGSTSGDHRTTQVNMGDDFDDTPVVFAQVASSNGGDTVTSRVSDVDADSFEFRLQEEEARFWHVPEQVDWIAIENGVSGDVASRMVNGVTHRDTLVQHDDGDAIFAQMQTFRGGDTANTRYDALGTQSRIWIDEETSKDPETWHLAEMVGVMTADLGYYDLFA